MAKYGSTWEQAFVKATSKTYHLSLLVYLRCLQNMAYLKVTSEETPTTELLNCAIMDRTEYVKQQGIALVILLLSIP